MNKNDEERHLMGTPLMRERARAGLDILRNNSRGDPKKIAAIGYCFGGTTVLELVYNKMADERSWQYMQLFFKEIF